MPTTVEGIDQGRHAVVVSAYQRQPLFARHERQRHRVGGEVTPGEICQDVGALKLSQVEVVFRIVTRDKPDGSVAQPCHRKP